MTWRRPRLSAGAPHHSERCRPAACVPLRRPVLPALIECVPLHARESGRVELGAAIRNSRGEFPSLGKTRALPPATPRYAADRGPAATAYTTHKVPAHGLPLAARLRPSWSKVEFGSFTFPKPSAACGMPQRTTGRTISTTLESFDEETSLARFPSLQ